MKLFQPLTIRNMTLKNRLVLPAMQLGLGVKSRRATSFYMERARGGAGAIITAATSVDLLNEDEPWGRPGSVEKFTEVMQSFTAEIRKTGARTGIQLWHGNQFPAGHGGDVEGVPRVAPSANDTCREISIAEIQIIIQRFAAAASQAKKGRHGFY